MPPSTFLGLLLFVWLVTPGFVFNYLAARRRPAQAESPFQDASRVVLASVLFSSMAMLVVLGVNEAVGSPSALDLRRVVSGDTAYLRDKYVLLAMALILQVLGACGLAWLGDVIVKAVIAKLSMQAPPTLRSESAWTKPLDLKPAGATTRVWVRLKSGVDLIGTVAAFDHAIDLVDRELVLTTPLQIQTRDGQLTLLQWQFIIVQGPDIEMLGVKYVTTDPPSTNTGPPEISPDTDIGTGRLAS